MHVFVFKYPSYIFQVFICVLQIQPIRYSKVLPIPASFYPIDVPKYTIDWDVETFCAVF